MSKEEMIEEQEQVVEDVAAELDEIEVLNLKIEEAAQLVAAAREEVEAAREMEKQALKAHDAIVAQRDALLEKRKGDVTHNEIVRYLKSQQEQREKRAQELLELRERGFDLGPRKSRLDQAMVRNRGYGQGRPAYPAVGAEKKG